MGCGSSQGSMSLAPETEDDVHTNNATSSNQEHAQMHSNAHDYFARESASIKWSAVAMARKSHQPETSEDSNAGPNLETIASRHDHEIDETAA